MPRDKRTITADDILSLSDYETIRKEKREENILRKKWRQLSVGPHATLTFESWDSMWLQIQEMLRVERGGNEQLVDELAAYNPMIPNGRELTATLFFEIDDPDRRTAFLNSIGDVDKHIYLSIDGEKVQAEPEGDVERTSASGKASAVHFLHFPMTDDQVAKFRSGEGQAMVGIEHPNYGHAAMIGAEARKELIRDL